MHIYTHLYQKTYLPTGEERVALELAGLYYYGVGHVEIAGCVMGVVAKEVLLVRSKEKWRENQKLATDTSFSL
jgi:hypothetical protein